MPIIDHIPKSLLCKFFAANQCERGTACTFAHSLDELNHIPEQDLSRKEGKFNAWDGDLSPAGLIPNVRECTTTMSWAIWCLKNERTVPDWVPKLCLQAIVQHGAPFLSQMQEVLQPGPTQEQEVPKPEATTPPMIEVTEASAQSTKHDDAAASAHEQGSPEDVEAHAQTPARTPNIRTVIINLEDPDTDSDDGVEYEANMHAVEVTAANDSSDINEKNKIFYAAMTIVGHFIEQENQARIQIFQRGSMLRRFLVEWARGAYVLPPPLVDSSSEEDNEDDDDDEGSDMTDV